MIVTFHAYRARQYEAAFLGVHFIGCVRSRADGCGEWIFNFEAPDGSPANWHRARDIDDAKAKLNACVEDWYDAAHQPLTQEQGERIARLMAVSR